MSSSSDRRRRAVRARGVKRKRQQHTGKKTSVNGDRKKTEAARVPKPPTHTHYRTPIPPPGPPRPLPSLQTSICGLTT